jgi:hypothetical protein
MQLIVHHGDQVFVEDFLFLVSYSQKPVIGCVELVFSQRIAEFFEARPQARAPRTRREDHSALRQVSETPIVI